MNLRQVSDEVSHETENASKAASQEFENFIYIVSHDIRNSIRALMELPQWIEEDLANAGIPTAGPVAENIQLMNTHTRRLDRMLIDLLIYSRIGRMQTCGPVDWHETIDTVLDQLQLPPGFRVTRDFRSPSINLGETDVLTLALALLSNAVKHHDRKDGHIRLTTLDTPSGQVFTITDDGPGIPENAREKVFQVMTTLKPRDEVEGSGMGLAHVRKIANQYGARIEFLPTAAERGCSLAVHFPRGGGRLN